MQSVLAVIDLKKLRANARLIARLAGQPVIAVVKDDAYGHGDIEIAHALSGAVFSFAVATVREGMRLRVGGITDPVLVLTPPLCREEALALAAYRLTATVEGVRTVKLFEGTAGAMCHIAVNTGMNRYGVRPDRAGALCRRAMGEGLTVTGVFSHLFAPEQDALRLAQHRAFSLACAQVRAHAPGAIRHLAATGGILKGETFDAVRTGIALYGYPPSGFVCRGLRPVMKVYATVASCRTPYGEGAGYGCMERACPRLHTLRLGYGDGFFRSGGLGIGKLCMDACIREGAAVCGRRKLVLADAEQYAREHGTTAYEVLVNIGKSAEKRYVN